MLSQEATGNNVQEKILFDVVLYSSDNIAQINTLHHCFPVAPDNSAQEKILFNVVLILLRQHCTCKNLVCNVGQEAPDNTAQGKILFNVVLILLGQHCTVGKYPMLCIIVLESPNNIAQAKTLGNLVPTAGGFRQVAHTRFLLNVVF